jgi:hypothetical protein
MVRAVDVVEVVGTVRIKPAAVAVAVIQRSPYTHEHTPFA